MTAVPASCGLALALSLSALAAFAAPAELVGGGSGGGDRCRDSGDTCWRDHVLLQRSTSPLVARAAPLAAPLLPERPAGRRHAAGSTAATSLAVDRISRAAGAARGRGGEEGQDARAQALEDIIALLEGEVITDMGREHRADQALVRQRVSSIEKCEEDLRASNATMTSRGNAVNASRASHTTCRSNETKLRDASVESFSHLHGHLKTDMAERGCQLVGSSDAADLLQQHMKCLAGDFSVDFSTAVSLFSKCNESMHAYRLAVRECDVKQDKYENLYCHLQADASDLCSEYNACHARETKEYQELRASVQEAESARILQAIAIEKIQCYVLKVLQAGDAELAREGEGESRLGQCDAHAGEAARKNFTLTYPSGPNVTVCPWLAWSTGEDVECRPACVSHSCKEGMILRSDSDSRFGSSDEACCEAACSSHACSGDGMVLRLDAGSLPGSSNEACCEAACSSYTCSRDGVVLRSDAGSIPGSSDETCCQAACSSHACSEGMLLRPDAGSHAGSSDEACCQASCSSHACSEGMVLLPDTGSRAGSSDEACCEAGCSSHACSEGMVLRADAGSIAGSSDEACCEASCNSHACSEGMALRLDADSLAGSTDDACCEAACSSHECNEGVLFPDAGSRVGSSDEACCQAACSSHTCGEGMALRPDAGSRGGSSDEACCEATCASHLCSEGMVLRPDAGSLAGSSDGACCEKSSGRYFLAQEATTWADALAYCRGLGTSVTLATIRDQAQQEAVAALSEGQNTWLGASPAAQGGTWTWVDDETPMTFQHWWKEEPNGSGDCAVMYGHRNSHGAFGFWMDTPCSGRYRGVCMDTSSQLM